MASGVARTPLIAARIFIFSLASNNPALLQALDHPMAASHLNRPGSSYAVRQRSLVGASWPLKHQTNPKHRNWLSNCTYTFNSPSRMCTATGGRDMSFGDVLAEENEDGGAQQQQRRESVPELLRP